MAGADRQKRGLHDWLSDTCVVYCHEKNYKNMGGSGMVQNEGTGNINK